MGKAGGRNALLTSAMIVAGIRMWMQLRGKTKTPFSEWAIGWGATFFILAMVSDVAPSAAGSLSLIIALSDFLVNGVGLTTDINSLIVGAQGGKSAGPTFVANPFGGVAPAAATTTTAGTSGTTTTTTSTVPNSAGSFGVVKNTELVAIGAKHGWSGAQITDWMHILKSESNGTLTDTNSSSGAYGLAQGITGPSWYAAHGGDAGTPTGQLTAMANYISTRYGDPSKAWSYHQAHNSY